ncbi:MAG: SpoIIE family protein phosphatase [Clostridia bacterium]|nr:SpoIIE family protein phosphatase [Clostridia bacterium]
MQNNIESKIEGGYAKRKSHFWGEIILYFCVFAMLTPARSGSIGGFCDGFFISAVSTYAPIIAVYPIFIVVQLFLSGEKVALIRSLVVSTVATACALITNRRNPKFKFCGCATVSAISLLCLAFFVGGEPIYTLVSGIITLAVAYVGKIALCGIYEKPKGFRPSTIELGCCGIILITLSTGLSSVSLYGYSPVYAFGMVVGATVCFLLGKGEGIISGVCVGIGQALFTFDVTAVAHFALVFTVYALFCSAVRPLACLSAFMASVVFWLYFRVNYAQAFPSLVSLVVGAVAFCLLPIKFLNRLKSVLFLPSGKVCMRHLAFNGRGDDAQKVEKVALIFRQMAKGLADFSTAKPDETAVSAYLEETFCAKCNRCEKEKRWGALCAVSSQIENNGSIIVKDNPYFLQVNCPNVAKIFTSAEKESENRRRKEVSFSAIRKRRMDGAKDMKAVADLLYNFNKTLSYPVVSDEKRENALVEELRYHGVVACDAIIEKGDLDKITVMVSSDTANGEKIVQVADRVFASSFNLVAIERIDEWYSVVKLMEKTPFDAVFAVSGQAKSKVATGDTHTFMKISPTKFIMAICDGMGHGESANKVSETAITLVESFYRAGFDSEYIIDCVNRFICAEAEEKFVAFDIFVCDLLTLESTLIKLGTPSSYIVTDSEVSLIEGSALPLGAISEIVPCIHSEIASEGQTVLLVSDGISDCYENNSLHTFVANYAGLSPKGLTDAVLAEAKRRKGGKISDDMTALAVKIIRRI